MKHATLNRVFAAYVLYFVLVIMGVLPRSTVPYVTALLLVWSALIPLEDAVMFFVRCIPLFIAIPLTSTYDNLNMWRLFAILILARLLLQKETRQQIIQQWRTFRWCMILLAFAALSLIGAAHPLTGVIRIIYFLNLVMVPFTIYILIRQGRLAIERVIKNLAIPTIIIIAVGYLQLISTYILDVYQFMNVWGEGIQLRQFGQEWSHIAVWVGNTWLAYYGDQLSLRVFSLLPDSHSFPTFVLLGLPALFALALDPIVRIAHSEPLKKLVRTYASLSIVLVPLAYLAMILSGTRGIWAASLGVLMVAVCLAWYFRRQHLDITRRRIFGYLVISLSMFFLLFAVAWPIFISPQFLVGKSDLGLFGRRLRSVIDFGETSNALRLAIWKSSLQSIARHPLLGVGIGNFPVVLGEDIRLARAGSTAHNLYLHVAAEMGIPAALEMTVLLAATWWSTVRWFMRATGRTMVYAGALTLYLSWVLAYVLTDPIIFDERVFLMFSTTLALIYASENV